MAHPNLGRILILNNVKTKKASITSVSMMRSMVRKTHNSSVYSLAMEAAVVEMEKIKVKH